MEDIIEFLIDVFGEIIEATVKHGKKSKKDQTKQKKNAEPAEPWEQIKEKPEWEK